MVARPDSVILYPELTASKLTHLDFSMADLESPDLAAGIVQRCTQLQVREDVRHFGMGFS